jgi:UDP-N-acetylmuramoyl-L-alanyl-D-glutamate--2,6-diaminopimelate ligase
LNLIGGFQAGNVLMAALLVIAAGEDPAHVFDTLEHLETCAWAHAICRSA